MRCDNCGQETDKNYFTDDLTILCADCAGTGQYKSGQDAMDYINGQPLAARSAVNITKNPRPDKPNKYKIDTGKTIQDGVITLAHMMLDTITEVKRNAND